MHGKDYLALGTRITARLRCLSSERINVDDRRHDLPRKQAKDLRRGEHIGNTHTEKVSPWNIANAVTVGRILAAPLTGHWIVTGYYDMALGGLIYAGISDWLDGFLARRLNLHTVIGSYLDPAADKLLISTTTVCLAHQDVIPTWLAALIIGRDVALVVGWGAILQGKAGTFTASRIYANGVPKAIEPLMISKVNTAMQITLCFAGVISAGDLNIITGPVVEGVGLATALTTSASGVSYALEYCKPKKTRF